MAEPYLENMMQMIASLNLDIQDEVQLECKHFFSGAALYANGMICASLTPIGFGLKLPASARRWLMESGDGVPLRYFENAPVKKEYLVLSQSILEDQDQLRSLVATSIDYTLKGESAT